MLFAQNLSLNFGPKVILNQISVSLLAGDRIALVGQNGAGKSTLLKILAGVLVPDSGNIDKNPHLRVAYLAQEPKLALNSTVLDAVRSGMDNLYALIKEHHDLCRQLSSSYDPDGQKKIQIKSMELSNQIDILGGFDIEHRVEEVLHRLHISAREQTIESLSGGERRRVDLARILLSSPGIYLLDEPTNHLDLSSIRFLVETFTSSKSPLLFISHDRAFIDDVATKIIEIEDGNIYTHETPYANYLENHLIRTDISSRTLHRKERLVVRELAWLRAGTPARTTKQNARIARADSLIEGVKKDVEKTRQKNLDVRLAKANRLGKTILELKNVGFKMGTRILFEDVNLIVTTKDRYGIVGPNGSGKTTLLKLISGELEPTTGTIIRGIHTQVCQFDQNRKQLDPELSLKETLAEQGDYVFVGEEKIHIASYLERFLFSPNDMNRKVETLSGGESNRLLLAKLFRTSSNCLLLDEPTNDLDITTLGVLEEILNDYEGVMFVVSHDRKFLDRVCTGIVAFEPNQNKSTTESNVVIYQGDYTTYERLKAQTQIPAIEKKTVDTQKNQPLRKKLKRSYNEQKEYENIESIILKSESERESIQNTLSNGEIFRIDPQKAKALTERLGCLEEDIDALYERWQYLENLGG